MYVKIFKLWLLFQQNIQICVTLHNWRLLLLRLLLLQLLLVLLHISYANQVIANFRPNSSNFVEKF